MKKGLQSTLHLGLSALLLAQGVLPAFAPTFQPSRAMREQQPARVGSYPTMRVGQHASKRSFQPQTGKSGFESKLDETGLSLTVPTQSDLQQWRTAIHSSDPRQVARAAVRLGEAAMAVHEPVQAEASFASAIVRTPKGSAEHGAARYGKAMALLHQGRYDAAEALAKSLVRHPEPGYDQHRFAAFLRHVQACAGYHRSRAEMGIAEPGRVDPLCGVAGMQKCAEAAGLKVSNGLVLKAVRHDGFGSDSNDLREGARKLGLNPYWLKLDRKGLLAAPKPLIAHVEHDHFITVTGASAKGVEYWCQDCGGTQSVTWKQWKAMEADGFLYCAKPGSVEDQALSRLPGETTSPSQILRVVLPSYAPPVVRPLQELVARLQTHATRMMLAILLSCGLRRWSLQCNTCPLRQPSCPLIPVGGDPVNAATGGEEYEATDLTVYNPTGPSVHWSRMYGSFAFPVENGFGSGWSNSYNWAVRTYSSGIWLYTPSGARVDLVADGTQTIPPTSSNPTARLVTSPTGYNCIVYWKYSSGGTYFEVLLEDRTVLTFGTATTVPDLQGNVHRLTRLTDRFGNYITFDYASHSKEVGTVEQLTSIKDSSGTALLTLTYNTSDYHLSAASDRYSRSVYYSSDRFEHKSVPSAYRQFSYELTQASQVVATGTSSPPIRYQYDYDTYGNGENSEQVVYLTGISEPNPAGSGLSTTTIAYDGSGYVDRVTDPNGNYATFTSLGTGGTKVVWKNASNTALRTLSFNHNSRMGITMVSTDVLHSYSDTLLELDYSDPYNELGPSVVTDGNSRTTSFTYDQFGHVLTKTTNKGTVTTNTYSYSSFPMGELTATQEGSNLSGGPYPKTSTTFTYYSNGLVHEVKTPIPGEIATGNRQTTTYTYTSLGNLASVTSPGNSSTSTHTATYGYTSDGSYSQSEALGQPITVTDTLGKVTHLRYDSRGNLTSVKDAFGNETTATYNIADQELTSVLPATGNTGSGHAYTGNTYLWTGGPVSQVKAYDESGSNVRTVDFAYGAAGELLSRTGSAESVTLTYDGLYHTKTLKDGNNSQTSYDYDALGRLAKISYPGATGTYYDQIQFTSYDNAGNVRTRVDGENKSTTYNYDDDDGLLSEVVYTSDTGQNVSITYDAFDRPVATTDGTGSSSTSYDDLDLVSSSSRTYTGLSAKTFDYLYYPDGSRQQMDTPAGSVTWEYDENGRFNYMTAFHDNKVNLTYLDNGWAATRELSCGANTAYSYNAAGMITGLANTLNGSTNVSSYGSFGYDGVFNLSGLTATVPGHTAYGGATSWTYDSKDRLTQESSARLSGYTDNFAYDSSGNPTTFKGSTRTFNSNNQRTSGSSYVYDGNGNPTTYAGSSLGFDRENRLTSIGSSWTAAYRADGLRAWKQVGSTKTYFLYDQGEPVIEMNASGTVIAFNAFGPDGLVGRKVGSTWTYYTFDPQGNVAERWDENGNVLDHSAYDAYGSESCTATPSDPWGYNAKWGYYADRETGLYLCQHRYYDPANGRWMTRDPIGYAGGVNVYGYCVGGPIGWIDPDGLCGLCDFVAGWGDTLSMGLTKVARKYLGEALGIGDANEAVDYDSDWYAGGELLGTFHDVALGAAGGWKLGAKGAGKEFSHWIPARYIRRIADKVPAAKSLLKHCRLNGNYVKPWFHALTDPYRRIAGQSFKALPFPLGPLLRTPFPISGGAIGGGLSGGHSKH